MATRAFSWSTDHATSNKAHCANFMQQLEQQMKLAQFRLEACTEDVVLKHMEDAFSIVKWYAEQARKFCQVRNQRETK